MFFKRKKERGDMIIKRPYIEITDREVDSIYLSPPVKRVEFGEVKVGEVYACNGIEKVRMRNSEFRSIYFVGESYDDKDVENWEIKGCDIVVINGERRRFGEMYIEDSNIGLINLHRGEIDELGMRNTLIGRMDLSGVNAGKIKFERCGIDEMNLNEANVEKFEKDRRTYFSELNLRNVKEITLIPTNSNSKERK